MNDAQFIRAHPDGATLEEVGAHLGLTGERVRQIEERALRKISRLWGNGGEIARGADLDRARGERAERMVVRALEVEDASAAQLGELLSMEPHAVRHALVRARAHGLVRECGEHWSYGRGRRARG